MCHYILLYSGSCCTDGFHPVVSNEGIQMWEVVMGEVRVKCDQ